MTEAKYVQAYPGEDAGTVAVESKMAVVVEEAVVRREEKEPPMQIVSQMETFQPQIPTDDDDEWFLLLDVVPREASYVSPGAHSSLLFFSRVRFYTALSTCLFPVSLPVKSPIRPVVDTMSTKQKLQQVDLRPKPSQALPQRDDEWLSQFDVTRDQAAVLPPGILSTCEWKRAELSER